MAENKDKELAYRVLSDKTPIVDVYFDGSYKIRTDIPEEDRGENADGRIRHLDENAENIREMVRGYLDYADHPLLQYNAPSDEYLDAFETLETLMFTPDFMKKEYDSDIEVQVFGGADVPWGKFSEGFFAGAVSVYERGDGFVSVDFG